MRFPRILKLINTATITSKSRRSLFSWVSEWHRQIGRVDLGITELGALRESACSLERECEIELPRLPLLALVERGPPKVALPVARSAPACSPAYSAVFADKTGARDPIKLAAYFSPLSPLKSDLWWETRPTTSVTKERTEAATSSLV